MLLAISMFAAPAHAALELKVGLADLDDARREPLEKLTRDAERDVSAILRTRLDGVLRVDYAGSDAAFRELVEGAGAGSRWSEPWISGLALLDQERVLIRMDGPGLLHTSETVRHELAHVAVHALSHGRYLPRWYHEAVAMVVAGEATADRLREVVGGGASGRLETLDALREAFGGHRLLASQAYATGAGFLRFALRRSGNPAALAELHERLHLGLDFEPAWIATFGLSPRDLYAVYAQFLDSAGSRWAMLLGDSMVWSIVSLLFVLSLIVGWRRRPILAPTGPVDLVAIAAAGDYAARTGRFVPPLDDLAIEAHSAASATLAPMLRAPRQDDERRAAAVVAALHARDAAASERDDGDDGDDAADDAVAGPPPSQALPRAARPDRMRARYEPR